MTYLRGRTPGRRRGRATCTALAPLLLLATFAPGALSQQAPRKYIVEVGAAGDLMTFDNATDLKTGFGALGRIGIWLPARFEVEAEGAFAKPKTESGSQRVTVKTFNGALLYNVPIGINNSAYLKFGVGGTTYGGNCPDVAIPGAGPCGTATSLLGGLGFRVAIVPTVLVRGEGVLNRNSSGDRKLTNFGVNLGASLMLGSKALVDSDGDGVLDTDDRCPATPAGIQVDPTGCPIDTDKDGVADGVDRCPDTPAGVRVNATGCPLDSDHDGVVDGVDKCPNTPAHAVVDASGCPVDSDKDGVADGLDRCPDTPKGATVDALGCPSDSDGDGVLDGIDQCPSTPSGESVNATGCAKGEASPSEGAAREAPARPPTASAAPPAAAAPPPAAPRPVQAHPVVLHGDAFALGSARLRTTAQPALDSAAAMLDADPALRVEIGAYTANTRSDVDSRRLANLRVEAVRSYFIGKGVRAQRLVSKFYGATAPVTSDTSAVGRALNRRIEITPLSAGP
ncbi:MAG TPA: OmpA family protein [Gemmatimonadales bacterium]|nr:OmpA family protein [Gemmatimonadales bacterium]